MLYKFLFPKYDNSKLSALLLCARIAFGLLLLSHGMQKLMNFHTLAATFPNPLGIGSEFSLILAIFAEVFCSIGFIVGFLYRLAMIPMIFTMFMAYFVIHGQDPFAVKELAFLYLIVFIFMYITGPGSFALDYFFARKRITN